MAWFIAYEVVEKSGKSHGKQNAVLRRKSLHPLVWAADKQKELLGRGDMNAKDSLWVRVLFFAEVPLSVAGRIQRRAAYCEIVE